MHAPPGSPPDSPTRDLVWLTLIVLGGAWLRLAALGNGLPAFPQVDEPEIVDRALHMMQTGSYNPAPFFDYPTFYIYVQTFVAVFRFMWGAMNGLWGSLDQLPRSDFYWEFYLWGRAVTAIFGSATIVVTYAIARRLGRGAALLAALIIAVQPLHVRESHYVLTDVPMTFFVALTLLLAVRAYERGTVRDYVLAGVTAGLAAATKYNGGVVIVAPLLALLFAGHQPKMAVSFVGILAGAAGAFLIAAPYTVLDLPAFLNAFGRLAQIYSANTARAEPGWLTYLKHLRGSAGWRGDDPWAWQLLARLTMLVAIGAAGYGLFALVRRRGAVQLAWATCLLFTAMWFTFVAGQSLIYARYLLPLLPPLAVIAGGGIAALVSAIPAAGIRRVPRAAIVGVVLAVAFVPPVRASVNFVHELAKVRTTDQAYEWIMQNVPAGSHVAIESRQILLPGDHFVSTNEARLANHSVEDFAAGGVQYLVAISSQFGQYVVDPVAAASPTGVAYRDLFRRAELIYTAAPSDAHPGPEIRVYRLAK